MIRLVGSEVSDCPQAGTHFTSVGYRSIFPDNDRYRVTSDPWYDLPTDQFFHRPFHRHLRCDGYWFEYRGSTATTFTFPGQIVILFLIQIGGVGLIVTIMFFFRILGRQIGLMDRLAVTSALRLDSPDKIISIVVRTVIGMLLLELLGALALGIHWLAAGIVPADSICFVFDFSLRGFVLQCRVRPFHRLASISHRNPPRFSNPDHHGNPDHRGRPWEFRFILICCTNSGAGDYPCIPESRWSPPLVLILLGWIGFLLAEYRLGGVLTEIEFCTSRSSRPGSNPFPPGLQDSRGSPSSPISARAASCC